MTYSEKLKDPRLANRSGIYRLNISDGFYIGSAVSLTKRLRQHLSDLRAARHCNIHLQRAFDKHGLIDFEIVEIVEDLAQLIAREQSYIDTLKPRYNIAVTAGSQLGFRHSAESRDLISRVQIGRVMSLEARQNMSAARKGVRLTDDHRRKLSASKMGDKNPFFKAGESHPQFGIPKSKTTKARISATSKERGSHKGKRNPSSKSGILYDVETGANYMFRSLKPMAEKLGIPYSGLCGAAGRGEFFFGRFYVTYHPLPDGVETVNFRSIPNLSLTRKTQEFDLRTSEGRRDYQREWRMRKALGDQ